MILTILGILCLALAGLLAFLLYWMHVRMGDWTGQTFWDVIKESYPRILILPALIIVGLVLIL